MFEPENSAVLLGRLDEKLTALIESVNDIKKSLGDKADISRVLRLEEDLKHQVLTLETIKEKIWKVHGGAMVVNLLITLAVGWMIKTLVH